MAGKAKAEAAERIDGRRVGALRRRLLRWYEAERRDLPWRARPGERADAYHVLVSEAMLQQTQVATVRPYFERFVEAFPRLADLASADEQAVLRLWEGLGYYRRARNLQAAARAIVERHGGVVPADPESLRRLPGVGDYTAGAIASIAFGRAEPAVDGNVQRVVSRWFEVDEAVDAPGGKRRIRGLAEQLVSGCEQPGDWNQALMELGARVCTARAPGCGACPAAGLCCAYKSGRVGSLPVRGARRAPRAVRHETAVVMKGGQVLLERRPEGGLWAGLWQMPTMEGDTAEPVAQWVARRYGLAVAAAGEPVRFRHQTTHRTIEFVARPVVVVGGRLRRGAGVWRPVNDVTDLPFANPQRRMLELARNWVSARNGNVRSV